MAHYGFALVGAVDDVHERTCVVWLFEAAVLDTPVKYAFATLGTFLLAVLAEALVRVRRYNTKYRCDLEGWRSVRAREAALYFAQAMLGFMLMLISMTYSTGLFFAIIFGLAVGHIVFTFEDP